MDHTRKRTLTYIQTRGKLFVKLWKMVFVFVILVIVVIVSILFGDCIDKGSKRTKGTETLTPTLNSVGRP